MSRSEPMMRVRPITVKAALPFVAAVHRRLPRVQGAMWAIGVFDDGTLVGVALVGHPARVWQHDTLAVLRVAVVDGAKNACSMLYGACARAARAMGADSLVTYTHVDEPGTTLRAAGWVRTGLTSGGEHGRAKRPRKKAVDASPKVRWFAPWSMRVAQVGAEVSANGN